MSAGVRSSISPAPGTICRPATLLGEFDPRTTLFTLARVPMYLVRAPNRYTQKLPKIFPKKMAT